MRIAICAIARLENRYIKEWVEYHLGLGFSHIYIYDNNAEDEERISDVIEDAMVLESSSLKEYQNKPNDCKVTIIPLHNRRYVQCYAYQDCYDYGEFDWVLFIDIDEFFTLSEGSGYKDVESFIEARKNDADAILINWRNYGDNGQLYYSPDGVIHRFPNPLPDWYSLWNLWGNAPENGHIKTFVRFGLNFKNAGPHIGSGEFSTCNAEGKLVPNVFVQQEQTYKVAYIRHYVTKSISEWAEQKVKRQAADGPTVQYHLHNFFLYNKPTLKKIKLYRHFCKVNGMISRPSLLWWLKQFCKTRVITPILQIIK